MSKARVVITAVVVEKRSKSEVARQYGVSRRWVHTLVDRYIQEGDAAFEPRSRRPHRSPTAIHAAVEEQVVRIRKELTNLGADAGAATIRWHLQQESGASPSEATIWRILTRRGFVTAQPHKRPKSSLQRFTAEQPNECWQQDFTHWQISRGRGTEILNVIDDHSRLAISCTAFFVIKGPNIVEQFRRNCNDFGVPQSSLTDNGTVFTARAVGGTNSYETELAALGVAQKNSRPYHPQTCGKVERFHQTQKKWLARQPVATTLAQLQQQLDQFRDYYNNARPHRSIERQTPATAYAARPKATSIALPAGPGFRLRNDTVDKHGKLTLRHNSRMHHIGIGRDHAGTPIRMLIDDLNIRVITCDGELIRELVLDTTRDYQPTGKSRYRKRSRK